jgi:AraC-like DNA-binding protein
VADARLAAALDYIDSHFSDPELSLRKVARALHISPRYLQRFLEASGRSFTAHVNELRLKLSLIMTKRGERMVRISDVALHAGYSNISHFNRLFRSRFGDTPSGVCAGGHPCSLTFR